MYLSVSVCVCVPCSAQRGDASVGFCTSRPALAEDEESEVAKISRRAAEVPKKNDLDIAQRRAAEDKACVLFICGEPWRSLN